MDWDSVWKVVSAAIASAGGAGAIIYAVAKVLAARIADRMFEKFKAENQHEFNKLMAEYQTALEKQKHASEVFFDTEFKAYEELIIRFNELINAAFPLFPAGLTIGKKMDTDEELLSDCNEKLNIASEKYRDANSILAAKSIYIPKVTYTKFEDILKKVNLQIFDYYTMNPYKMKYERDVEIIKARRINVERTKEINNDWNNLVDELREHLQSLSIRRE